jgi:hypothetical protein
LAYWTSEEDKNEKIKNHCSFNGMPDVGGNAGGLSIKPACGS